MNVEYEIQTIKEELQNLRNAFVESQKNQANKTDKIDNTSNRVDAITPYTDMATAYIDDAYVIFENVPAGNMSVYFDNPTDYVVERNGSTVLISFEPLEKVTVVTISIQ